MRSRADDRARARLTRPVRQGAIVAALLSAGLSAAFMVTIVLPIQSELPVLLDASRDDTAWVVTASLLSSAVGTPIAGKLGDMYGRRRVLLALIALQFAGAVVAALSTSVLPLIIGRGLQGLALGVIPLGIAIMRDSLHRDRLGPAIGLMSATIGIGGALGLPLAGFVTHYFDWHVLFWLSAGFAGLGFVLVLGFVPVSTLRSAGRLDIVGAIGMCIALTCILLAVTRGNDWGWSSPATIGLFAAGTAVLLGWVWWELRMPNPIADLRVAVRPSVLLTNTTSVALAFSLFAGNIIYPQLLELPVESGVGLGLALDATGLVMLPHSLAVVVMSPIAGRLIAVVGPKSLLAAGGVMAALGYALSLLVAPDVWVVLLVNVLLGSAAGTAFAAMPTLIMRAVPATEAGAANGLNSLMRALGNSVSAAVIGAILANSVFEFEGSDVPTSDAFRATFVIGLVAAAAATAIALSIPRHRAPATEHEALPEPLPDV